MDDAPVALSDTVDTQEDQPIEIDVLANDSDVDSDAPTIESIETPDQGTVEELADGRLRYTPPDDFFGEVSFDYVVVSASLRDTASVHITVVSVNDTPVVTQERRGRNKRRSDYRRGYFGQ